MFHLDFIHLFPSSVSFGSDSFLEDRFSLTFILCHVPFYLPVGLCKFILFEVGGGGVGLVESRLHPRTG